MTKYLKYPKDKPFLQFSIVLISFGLTLIMTGCNGTSTQVPTPEDTRLVDQSFVTGQPCQAPCWYGIEPGSSIETEVLQTLKELPFIDYTKVKIRENIKIFNYQKASEINFKCIYPDNTLCGRIISVEKQVEYIDLYIQYPLSLKSVIDQRGVPEYLYYTPATPHGDGCRVVLYWPDQRISVVNDDSTKESVMGYDSASSQLCQDLQKGEKIRSDLQITEVHYMSEEIALQNPCDKLECIAWPGFLDK